MNISTHRKKSRKAQMEMMGLAIVVVLLVIGMAFVFKALMSPPKRVHEKFTKEQTAQSILIAVGRSVTYCSNLDMTELMQDCGDKLLDASELQTGDCVYCRKCSAGESSCKYLNTSLKNIFDNTLRLQRLPYRFMLYKTIGANNEPNPLIYIEDGGCNTYNIRQLRRFNVEKPGELTLPLPSGGTVYARLDICTTA